MGAMAISFIFHFPTITPNRISDRILHEFSFLNFSSTWKGTDLIQMLIWIIEEVDYKRVCGVFIMWSFHLYNLDYPIVSKEKIKIELILSLLFIDTCYRTSNARSFDSLDPRLNIVRILFHLTETVEDNVKCISVYKSQYNYDNFEYDSQFRVIVFLTNKISRIIDCFF